jgi:glycosyltransferase involved in cell wall biosynthesis
MKKNILLISHYIKTPGMVDKYFAYCKRKGHDAWIIKHPLFPSQRIPSKIISFKKTINFYIPPILSYPFEGIVTAIKWMGIKNKKAIDLAIAFDPLSFINIYLFRSVYNVKNIVYYNLDYSKKRFSNPLLNFIYKQINLFAFKHCDYFFSVVKMFLDDLDPKGKYAKKTFIVKHPVETTLINFKTIRREEYLVYAGNIGDNVDFSFLFSALNLLKKEGIIFHLDIYGGENGKRLLGDEVGRMGLSKIVSFKDSVSNETLVRNILPSYGIGICPYVLKKKNKGMDHMYHGSDLTSKLVEYIAAGLPIVTTKIYDAFEMIPKENFGFLVETKDEWYKALKALITDKNLQEKYRANAIRFAKKYDEEEVITPIFKKINSRTRPV